MKTLGRFPLPAMDRVLMASLILLLAAFLVVLMLEPGAVGRGGR